MMAVINLYLIEKALLLKREVALSRLCSDDDSTSAEAALATQKAEFANALSVIAKVKARPAELWMRRLFALIKAEYLYIVEKSAYEEWSASDLYVTGEEVSMKWSAVGHAEQVYKQKQCSFFDSFEDAEVDDAIVQCFGAYTGALVMVDRFERFDTDAYQQELNEHISAQWILAQKQVRVCTHALAAFAPKRKRKI